MQNNQSENGDDEMLITFSLSDVMDIISEKTGIPKENLYLNATGYDKNAAFQAQIEEKHGYIRFFEKFSEV